MATIYRPHLHLWHSNNTPSRQHGAPERHNVTHDTDMYMAPSKQIHTPCDVLGIQWLIHIDNQTAYLVTIWSPEILTQDQTDTCMAESFQANKIHT
jgi:hypothetical protein